jgi:hypothetical protein
LPNDKRGIKKGFARKKEKGFFPFMTLGILGGIPKEIGEEFKRDERNHKGLRESCYGFVHSKLKTKLDSKPTHEHRHNLQTNLYECKDLLATSLRLTWV